MSCAVCSSTDVRPKLRTHGVLVLQCAVCSLAFWRPEEGFDPARLYDGAYFAGETSRGYDDYAALEPALRATFRRRVERLGAPPGARLLDVGAAYGFALSEALRAGLRATGIELSAEASARAAAGAPGRVVRGSGLALPFASGAFDVVTLWDVLEHLPEPQRAVAEIARCLRPGGRLLLTTGDVGSLVARISGPRWHLYTIPEHLFFYSRASLRRLLEANGLLVLRMRAEGASYPVGYLAERLRKTILRRTRTTAPSFPGARLVLHLNLFDILCVEAVRLPQGGGRTG